MAMAMAAGTSSNKTILNSLSDKIASSKIKFTVLNRDQFDCLDNVKIEKNTIKAFGLPHNVICIKRLLSEQEQIKLIHLSNDLFPSSLLEIAPFPQHTPWIYLNWPAKFMEKEEEKIINSKEKEKNMQSLLDLGAILGKMIISIAQNAQKQNEEKEEKEKEYEPKAIYGILYQSRGFLEAHTDAHQGWIVSISIGAMADFWYSNQKKMDNQKNDEQSKHRINIQSGDVMVFPGYRLMHGVDSVDQNVPKFWTSLQQKQVVPKQFVRYCLQFRHPLN